MVSLWNRNWNVVNQQSCKCEVFSPEPSTYETILIPN
ncbi:hypothetical protein C344_04084 [Cryptococcus neoformans AD1-7a]|nr:hypothetical protein C344_04084 [Cryptococcus neoformans var. grubii AD1-7a]